MSNFFGGQRRRRASKRVFFANEDTDKISDDFFSSFCTPGFLHNEQKRSWMDMMHFLLHMNNFFNISTSFIAECDYEKMHICSPHMCFVSASYTLHCSEIKTFVPCSISSGLLSLTKKMKGENLGTNRDSFPCVRMHSIGVNIAD